MVGGVVTASDGTPIAGAYVDPRSLSLGVITDADGRWQAAARDPKRFLKSMRVVLPGQRPITIKTDPAMVTSLLEQAAVIRAGQP